MFTQNQTSFTLNSHTSDIFSFPPKKLIERIAIQIESDEDLISFALTCRGIEKCILAAESGVWRARFNEKYDAGWKYRSEQLMVEYQTRALVLGQRVFIQSKETARDFLWLEVLQTLLVETYVTRPNDERRLLSKNLIRIAEAVKKTNFLSRPMLRDERHGMLNPSDLYCSVQLVNIRRVVVNLKIN